MLQDLFKTNLAEKYIAVQLALTRVLSVDEPLGQTVPKFLEIICKEFEWELGELWTIDEEANFISFSFSWSKSSQLAHCLERNRPSRLPSGKGFPGLVWKYDSPLWLSDVDHKTLLPRFQIARALGLKSALCFPLNTESKMVAVVCLFSLEEQRKNETLVSILEDTSHRLGIYLDRKQKEGKLIALNAELEKRVEERTRDLEKANKQLQERMEEKNKLHAKEKYLAEATKRLNESLNFDETLNNLANLLVPEMADWCSIDVVSSQGITNAALAHVDLEKLSWAREFRKSTPLMVDAPRGIAHVIKTQKAELYPIIKPEDYAHLPDQQRLHVKQLDLKSVLIVPMVAHGKSLGSISLYSSQSERIFDKADLRLASDIASLAANAVENAKLYSEVAQADRAKSEFLAILSHELRTPLNIISGWAEILKNVGKEESIFDEAIDAIGRNARIQTSLVTDLLDISNVITGRMNIRTNYIEFNSVVSEALSSVRHTASAKDILIEAKFHKLEAHLVGDQDRLRQVVWNLLSNAIKFTPVGGHIVVVVNEINNYIEFSVTDTGQGIQENFLPHIFEIFRQQDSKFTRRHGGLGLGLSLVKYLVEAHGGTVKAESGGEGRGSTFSVSLPKPTQTLQFENSKNRRNSSRKEFEKNLNDVRVLIVNDSAETISFLSQILKKSGAEVFVAANGSEATKLMQKVRPDLIVSDIEFSEKEKSYFFMEELRKMEPSQGGTVPAIALTTNDYDLFDQGEVLRKGFTSHLKKPVSPSKLIRSIASLVAKERPFSH